MFRTSGICLILLIFLLLHNSAAPFVPIIKEKFKTLNLQTFPKNFLPKCCEVKEMLDSKTFECISNSGQFWTPIFYSGAEFVIDYTGENITYKIGPPCENNYVLLDEKLTLFNDGKLMVTEMGGYDKVLEPDQYCIDTLLSGPSNVSNKIGSEIIFEEVAFVCERSDEDRDTWRYTVYATLMLASVFFLTLSALVHLILWEQGNIHSWLQFSYTISLLLSFACLALVQVWSFEIRQISQQFCIAMASMSHFFFLSVFFWLTSLNFDLWMTFGKNRITKFLNNLPSRRFRRTFLYYNLFSYGVPAIFAIAAITIDSIYRGDPNPPFILPRFGVRSCHFYDVKAQLPYLYGPLGVLLCIDIGFFVSTICGLTERYKENKLETNQSTATSQERKRFILFVKLFIVMGFLWVFEFLSWTSLTYFPSGRGVVMSRILTVTDILNCSKGIAIFVIYVCKRDVLNKLKAKLRKVHGHLSSMKVLLEIRTSDSSQKTLNTSMTEVT